MSKVSKQEAIQGLRFMAKTCFSEEDTAIFKMGYKAIAENEKLKLENATLKKSNEMLQKSIEKVRNEINETCTFWNEDWDSGFNSAVDIFKKHLGGDWE